MAKEATREKGTWLGFELRVVTFHLLDRLIKVMEVESEEEDGVRLKVG